MLKTFFSILLLFFTVFLPSAYGADIRTLNGRPFQEGQNVAQNSALSEKHETSTVKIGMTWLIRFFQKYLSPVDGPKCPHYPTCSEFCRQAILRYGPVHGVLMTADRLSREYPDMPHSGDYLIITVNGVPRVYDPIENEYLGKFSDLVPTSTEEEAENTQ